LKRRGNSLHHQESMFLLSQPSADEICAFLGSQADQPFSYPYVGATREQPPRGYTFDHSRALLGHGIAVFERGVKAVRQWKMFDIPWLRLCWPETPIAPGATVAVLVSHLGFWSLNACRIIHVIEEHGTRRGTALPTEPCSSMPRQAKSASPWNFIPTTKPSGMTFTPSLVPALSPALHTPISRALQRRFARDSKSAMQKAVGYSEILKR